MLQMNKKKSGLNEQRHENVQNMKEKIYVPYIKGCLASNNKQINKWLNIWKLKT